MCSTLTRRIRSAAAKYCAVDCVQTLESVGKWGPSRHCHGSTVHLKYCSKLILFLNDLTILIKVVSIQMHSGPLF